MHKVTMLSLLVLGMASVGCLGPRKPAAAPAPEIRWGYSAEHPLPMASIQASYAFLDRLRTPEGHPVRYRRLGSTLAPEGSAAARNGKGILDIYELTDDAGATHRLWLDPYAGRTSADPPEGFCLPVPQQRRE